MRKERRFIFICDSIKDQSPPLLMNRFDNCHEHWAKILAVSAKHNLFSGKNGRESGQYHRALGKIISPFNRYAPANPELRRICEARENQNARASNPAVFERIFIRSPISKARLQRIRFESCRDVEGARS